MGSGVGVGGMVNAIYGIETAATGVLSRVSGYYSAVFCYCIAGV